MKNNRGLFSPDSRTEKGKTKHFYTHFLCCILTVSFHFRKWNTQEFSSQNCVDSSTSWDG